MFEVLKCLFINYNIDTVLGVYEFIIIVLQNDIYCMALFVLLKLQGLDHDKVKLLPYNIVFVLLGKTYVLRKSIFGPVLS